MSIDIDTILRGLCCCRERDCGRCPYKNVPRCSKVVLRAAADMIEYLYKCSDQAAGERGGAKWA